MKEPRYILLLLSLLCMPPAKTEASTADERFVSGLVARRLFSLAELACQDQLARADVTVLEQASWTVELIRVYAQHAANSLPSQRPERWQAAHQTAERFLAEQRKHPRRILVELQDALTYLAQGELARLEASVAVDPEQAFENARETIRQAAQKLESVDKQVTTLMTTRGSRATAPPGLSDNELFSLQNNVRFQLARAFRNQALCYPAESSDRAAALSLAVEQLNATLAQLQPSDSLTLQVYVQLATVYRLLGDLAKAQRALTAPLAESVPVPIQLDAAAELARVMTAAGRPQQAIDELSRMRTKLGATSADLDFAELEAMLTLWTAAADRNDDVLARRWQERVAQAVRQIEQAHGPYWGRRARLGQLAVAGQGMASGDVDILVSSAGELYLKKQYDEAIAAYERAAELARSADDLQKAMEIEYTAALIEQEQKRHVAASRRLRRLALEQATNPQSPSLHLTAVWNIGQAARSDPAAIEHYGELLEEHLNKWPEAETANKARRWLGDLRRSQDDWEGATAAYRGITRDSPLLPDAIVAAGECWNQWLNAQRREGKPTAAILADATEYLDALILGPQRTWPERWSPAQLNAALATARLRLDYSQNGLIDAQRVLQAAIPHAPTDDAAWLKEAQSLLVVALAGQAGREEEALHLIQQLGAHSTDHLLELIDSLSQLAENATPETRNQIANVQLAALTQLQSATPQLAADQKLRVDIARATALRTAGKLEEALQVYRQLARLQPDNGSIQIAYADLLLHSDGDQPLTEAISQWQKVARRVRPNTAAWFQARYSIALALYKRNRPAQGDQDADWAVAARRLRYLEATSNVAESAWNERVAKLLAQVTN